MRKPIHDDAIELLLASMSQQREDGLLVAFVFTNPDAPYVPMQTELYYRPSKLTRAALHVRQHGPPYLRYLAIGDIWRVLQRFVIRNYWYVANDVLLKRFDGSYADQVSAATKSRLAEALAASDVFQPRDELTLFPLVPVRVVADFDSGPFFLITPPSLDQSKLPAGVDVRRFVPDRFPPLSHSKGRTHQPAAWLGIRSPAFLASNKMKAAILGAVALTPLPDYRYLFSGRPLFGGRCTILDGDTTSHGEAHTPPLMHDILVTEQDHPWLSVLASKLMASERAVRRQLRALEYFYRAWELGPSERFPVLCMTLDAVFGDANHATQAVIDGVRGVLGSHVRGARLRLLMDLRASVIHGGAPDVYDSRKYARYYDQYDADPIYDLELVVASCLRRQIFSDALKEHPDPNAEIIAEAQARGRLPKNISRATILEDDPSRIAG